MSRHITSRHVSLPGSSFEVPAQVNRAVPLLLRQELGVVSLGLQVLDVPAQLYGYFRSRLIPLHT